MSELTKGEDLIFDFKAACLSTCGDILVAFEDYRYRDTTEHALREYVVGLEARIARLESERMWIPVSERLPETDGQYLGCTNAGFVSTHWFVKGQFVVTYSCEYKWRTAPTTWALIPPIVGENIFVTHWMPLPEVPQEREK